MPPRSLATAILLVRRLVTAPTRTVRARPVQRELEYWERPEFPRVNTRTGIEPLKPELSGLQVRSTATPGPLTRLLSQIGYRWIPSENWRRRQQEMGEMNGWLHRRSWEGTLPPILTFPEDTDVSATRVQPFLDRLDQREKDRNLPRDLTDLEEMERVRRARVLRPPLSSPNPRYFVTYRPLLPRQYREFLRYSPYPRIAVTAVALVVAISGWFWLSETQKAEALASRHYHVVRHAFHSELDAARVYGVDPTALHPLEARSQALEQSSAPAGLIAAPARAHFYGKQAREYSMLLHTVRKLERQALRYWTWRAAATSAALNRTAARARTLGLAAPGSPAISCHTPRCYRGEVGALQIRLRGLTGTTRTLRLYGRAIAASANPPATAARLIQEDHALAGVLGGTTSMPASIGSLDSMYAAGNTAAQTRAGALARLDLDTLQADLSRRLPGRAVVVSVEDQRLVCYQRGHAVYSAPVTAGADTVDGIFHIGARQASVATVLWSRPGSYSTYRYGVLPDWMPFSASAGLQGAPWRQVFGPGSDQIPDVNAPSTPGSIDLPPHAARFVFGWVAVGTEVVVY